MLRFLVSSFLLFVSGSVFAITCDPGYTPTYWDSPPDHICFDKSNGYWYDTNTMLGKDGVVFTPVSPTSTGYVPPVIPASAVQDAVNVHVARYQSDMQELFDLFFQTIALVFGFVLFIMVVRRFPSKI